MPNYINNIRKSGISIYELVSPENKDLFIPTIELENILNKALCGISLNGLALRTRSKVVKSSICEALGYPIPKSFKKTQPRFPSQNFDVYTQKSMNLQIWNEEIDPTRRYVIIEIDNNDVMRRVRVLTGDQLAFFDNTGTLTTKFQATMRNFGESRLFSNRDTQNVSLLCNSTVSETIFDAPNSMPNRRSMLPISQIYCRLLPLIGKRINRIDAIQERNRGAELHRLICQHLGFNHYADDGTYPDILNQLVEIKLQTSPTIDLGLHSPEETNPILQINGNLFYSSDIRYVIVDAKVEDNFVILNHLYVVNGEDFCKYFPMFGGNIQNAKIQLPLPTNFFD
ncbi:hypothetical protein [Hydrogenoanaerobacterium sp.]|uniref:hypothetical protein n=1 Tax=Hydrogenoanaerobacterium sp. TaxID=2953763 RepID=UPI002897BE6B|nr:hypothetical protein [Hydrogenoanaerobacterium sp.]